MTCSSGSPGLSRSNRPSCSMASPTGRPSSGWGRGGMRSGLSRRQSALNLSRVQVEFPDQGKLGRTSPIHRVIAVFCFAFGKQSDPGRFAAPTNRTDGRRCRSPRNSRPGFRLPFGSTSACFEDRHGRCGRLRGNDLHPWITPLRFTLNFPFKASGGAALAPARPRPGLGRSGSCRQASWCRIACARSRRRERDRAHRSQRAHPRSRACKSRFGPLRSLRTR